MEKRYEKYNIPPDYCVELYDELSINDKPFCDYQEPVDENNPNYVKHLKSTYAPGISSDKGNDTITGRNPYVGIKTLYDKWRTDILYGGNTNTHTKPKNRRNKVKRKHR